MKLIKYNPAFLDAAERARRFGARHQDLAALVRIVRENLSRPHNQHVLVVAPRGMGKTTLLLRLLDEVVADPELAAGWLPITAPEELYRVSSIGDLWLETVFGLHRTTGDPVHERAYENLKRAYADHGASGSDARLAEAALAYLLDFADRDGKRLLLIAENLQMLFGDQLAEADAWAFRATLIGEPRIMMLASAVSAFEGIEDPKAPLYEQFLVMRLYPLDLDECLRLWRCLTGQDMPRRRMRAMQILTGGNPRLLVILAEFAARLSLRELTEDLANLLDEHTDYLKMTTEALPPLERKIFVTLAEIWEDASSGEVAAQARVTANVASAQLARLESRGVVVSRRSGRGKQYRVAERLYSIYHLMRRRGGTSARARAVTEFMVAYYDQTSLRRQIERMAHEALGMTSEDRSEHLAVLGAFVEVPSVQRWLARDGRIPLELLADPTAPEALRRWRREGSSARKARASVSPAAQLLLAALESANHIADEPARALELLKTAVANATLDESSPGDARALAAALRIIAFLKSRQGDRVGALESAQRAVEVIEAARKVDSSAPLPDLARSLDHLSTYQSDVGRRENALATSELAVEIYEGLVKDGLSAFLSDLAGSLNNLSNRQSDLGRREDALASIERAVEIREGLVKDEPAAFLRDLAMSLNNLSNCQSDMGRREDALASIERAVEIYEGLAKDNPAALLPELVTSLNNLSNCQSELGRREDALATIERTVRLREGLAKDNPAAFLPGLAGSLSSLSNRQYDLGRCEDALATIERAVEIHEELVKGNPAAFLPDLAMSLHNLSNCQSELGRREDALATIERAVEIRELLAKGSPSAFLPDLAASLNNLSGRQSDLGLREDALATIERAVEMFDGLAKGNPSAFLPELATSLNNLSDRQSELGFREDALETIERAVEMFDDLAKGIPSAFLPNLATSLNGLSNRQSDVGRPEDALATIERAVEIYEGLAKENPSAFLPDLAKSLNKLSSCYAALGRGEAALAAIERAVEIDRRRGSSNPTAVRRLALALVSMARNFSAARDTRRAEEALHEALSLDPQELDARVLLGQLLATAGRHAAALDQLRQIAAAPEQPEASLRALIDLAVAIAAGGNARQALEVLQTSPSAPQIEPLIVALARSVGRQVTAPGEVDEIAADIMEEIRQAAGTQFTSRPNPAAESPLKQGTARGARRSAPRHPRTSRAR